MRDGEQMRAILGVRRTADGLVVNKENAPVAVAAIYCTLASPRYCVLYVHYSAVCIIVLELDGDTVPASCAIVIIQFHLQCSVCSTYYWMWTLFRLDVRIHLQRLCTQAEHHHFQDCDCIAITGLLDDWMGTRCVSGRAAVVEAHGTAHSRRRAPGMQPVPVVAAGCR